MATVLYLIAAVEILFLLSAHAVDVRGRECSTADIEADMKTLYTGMKGLARSSPAKMAAMVRHGFHDCATTVANKPKSGCNGSIRNELNVPSNARLVTIMGDIESQMFSSAPCVTYADAILIAYAAATKEAGGGSFVTDLVDPSNPREDVPDGVPDSDDTTGFLLLPNPFASSFEELLKFYTDRGLTARDLVVSNVVGHSLGGFAGSPDATGAARILPFTSDVTTIGPLYAGHLSWRHASGSADLAGFNTLPSDEILMTNPTGEQIIRGYSSFTDEGPDAVSFSWQDGGMLQALRDFREFSIRMSQMSGDIMTGAKQFDLSRVADRLRKETAGWDGPVDEFFTRPEVEEEEEEETEVEIEVDQQTERRKRRWRDVDDSVLERRFRPPGNPWFKKRKSRGRGRGRGPRRGRGRGRNRRRRRGRGRERFGSGDF